jgi:hypothetical protein
MLKHVFLLRESEQQFTPVAGGQLPVPPPGLSQLDLNAVVDSQGRLHGCQTRLDVIQAKLRLIKLLNEDRLFDAESSYLALLCAAGSPHEDVSDRAETAVRRKNLTLTRAPLIQSLFQLFTGTLVAAGQTVDPKIRRSAASPKLKLAVMKVLQPSEAAASQFPTVLQVSRRLRSGVVPPYALLVRSCLAAWISPRAL